MQLNYGELQDLIVEEPEAPGYTLREGEHPNLTLTELNKTNILRRLLRFAFWPYSETPVIPVQDDLKAKRNVNKNPGIQSGTFFSRKMQRQVQYEAAQEKRFYEVLEDSKDVSWYAEQPLKIPYSKDGAEANYFPDVLICLGPGRYLVAEVKPSTFMGAPGNIPKYHALRNYCAQAGWGLLITDGNSALGELAKRPLNPRYVTEMLARLKDAPMNKYEYKEIEKHYHTNDNDLAALIFQHQISLEFRPGWQLEMKSKTSRIW